MNEHVKSYLNEILPASPDWAKKLEGEARENHVPIMDRVSMNFVMQLIRIKKPKRILEIGTAIGYSALRMVEASPETKVVTIEKDEVRYQQALNNIKANNKEDRIRVLLGDALEKLKGLEDNSFDFIFIDAAKGKYRDFFILSERLLVNDGLIISDNVLFRGYVAKPEEAHRRHEKMVEKIRVYNEWLFKHTNFSTSIVPIGDGVAISLKNNKKGNYLHE
ncbi:O-methyltransferase [Virgibacillus halodenitrificans]|uniref:O-methyltransferase n=1 Tax=Virgibacillus halodenitrificans TaxID=1482 RepID=UPI0024C0A229|nr:O-methyltransferase [Virgibacillus halodenitrificans]WHX27589.1 O-methyltransferase [Virgibacillus halodenitrificans]